VPVTPLRRQLEPASLEAQALEVEQQVVDPQAGPLADGGRLRRLEVGHAEARLVGQRARAGERRDHGQQRRTTRSSESAAISRSAFVADEAEVAPRWR